MQSTQLELKQGQMWERNWKYLQAPLLHKKITQKNTNNVSSVIQLHTSTSLEK